jgi:hypothetical protein
MNKIELAKLLGLEVEFEYCDNMYEEDDFELEMEFTIGGKYFEVLGYTKEECWEKAATEVVDNLLKVATIHMHSESKRYR